MKIRVKYPKSKVFLVKLILIYLILENDWSGNRISSDTPSIASCALLASSGDIEGEWDSQTSNSIDNWDICLSNSEYESSFDNGDLNGYESGVTHKSGLIGSGYYYGDANSSDRGVSLIFLLSDGTLGNFNWLTAPGDDPDPNDYDGTSHSYIIYNLSTNQPSDSDCSRNDNLYEDDNDDGNGNDDDNDSGAATLTAGIVMLVVLFLF